MDEDTAIRPAVPPAGVKPPGLVPEPSSPAPWDIPAPRDPHQVIQLPRDAQLSAGYDEDDDEDDPDDDDYDEAPGLPRPVGGMDDDDEDDEVRPARDVPTDRFADDPFPGGPFPGQHRPGDHRRRPRDAR